ncbi:MAG: phage holin family protein [Prevotellaceae bacterium]|jgi:hypothetical protein|nr:phage holin family protein [Prevotellaceae bacterium]
MSEETVEEIKDFRGLIREVRAYLALQKEYAELELTEKLTMLFSGVLLILVLTLLGMLAFFFLAFSLAYWLAPHVGGLLEGFVIVALLTVIVMLLIYLFRRTLIITPTANYIVKLFARKTDT